MLLLDRAGRILDSNISADTLLDEFREDLLGKRVSDVLGPCESVETMLNAWFEHGASQPQTCYRIKDKATGSGLTCFMSGDFQPNDSSQNGLLLLERANKDNSFVNRFALLSTDLQHLKRAYHRSLNNESALIQKADELEQEVQRRRELEKGLERKVVDRSQALLEAEKELYRVRKTSALAHISGGIAHDFNNLLVPVLALSELMTQDDSLAKPHQDNAKLIYRAASQAVSIVERLMVVGKRLELDLQTCKVSSLSTQIEQLAREGLEGHFKLDFQPLQISASVELDRHYFFEAITDLLSNAKQAMPEGGTIKISQSIVKAKLGKGYEETYYCLSIGDEGKGIDNSAYDHIFEPYFSTRKAGSGRGVGLGLAAVQAIVEQHNGSVEVESQIGRGATFKLYFPAFSNLEGEPQIMNTQADQSGENSPRKVLLIDDEEMVLETAQRLLNMMGYEVSAYLEPESGVSAVRESPDEFCLLLVDFSMQDVTGIEVAREVRQIRDDLPVVIFSGYSNEEVRREVHSIPGAVFMSKPFVLSKLRQTIAEAMA